MITKQSKQINAEIEATDPPLIQIFDDLKRQADKMPVPFDSPDISLTKERAPTTVFAK